VLLRAEEALPEQLFKEVDLQDAQVVAEGVFAFDLSWAANGEQLDTWDSTGVEQLDQTPQAVQVTLQLWERDESGAPVPGPPVTRVIELPVRPEYLEPREAQASDQSCPTGISSRDCMQRWLPVLSQYAPETQEHFGELFSAVQDACWDPPDPSLALRELHRQLRQAVRLSGSEGVAECAIPE
jgi:hypothetical protein